MGIPKAAKRRSFFARIWAKLIAHERRHRLLRPGEGVVAAVSGGPDSMCLAHYLYQRSKKLGLGLKIVHIHHGLRGHEAERDAAFVQRLEKKLGVPVEVLRVDLGPRARTERRGIEEAGRAVRYQTLSRVAARYGFNKVATGHTLSDHAETVLLHLLRGTEPKGLLGIPIKRQLRVESSEFRGGQKAAKLEVVRPILCLTREEVLEYLRFFGLSYRVDKTNRNQRFLRNWVRRRLIPLLETKNPKLAQHLGVLSKKLRRQLSVGSG